MAFLEGGCRETYPNAIRTHIEDQEFIQFVMKYAMVSRQMLFNGLKNPARQRRNINRLFEDLNILMGEANYTDDSVLQRNKLAPNQINTVALNMSLTLVSRAQLEYLQQGFALEIYGLHELPMVFAMLKVASNLHYSNKKNAYSNFCNDLFERGIREGTPKFLKAKEKFTGMQKLVCNEMLYFKALAFLYGGLFQLTIGLVKAGVIPDILEKENVAEQTFQARFAPF